MFLNISDTFLSIGMYFRFSLAPGIFHDEFCADYGRNS
jgi:hypothetical protein